MWDNLLGIEIVFLICAVTGTIFLFVRLVLQFIGTDSDVDTGTDVDVHHIDADVSFKLLSLHGLTSFLLMFGLVGFALYRQSNTGAFIAILGGIIAGLIAVWIIGKLFASIGKLQSSGTMDISSAIGSQGTVYLTIPQNGKGRVTVNFKNRLCEFDASSHDKKEITTGTAVKVIWVESNTLVVEKIK